MDGSLANYEQETADIKRLVNVNDSLRILMFQGNSGTGKTTLLKYCLKLAYPHFYCVPIELRREYGPINILNAIGTEVEWEYLPVFTNTVAQIIGSPDLAQESTWRNKMKHHLEDIITNTSPDRRNRMYSYFTGALFEKENNLSKPIVLAIDNFDKCSTHLRDWFDDDMLPKIVQRENAKRLCVLFVGQDVPVRRTEWESYCQYRELRGVIEAKKWLPVLRALGRKVPLLYFAGVCDALNGNPRRIFQWIESQPVHTGSSQISKRLMITYSQMITRSLRIPRNELKRMMEETFNKSDLKLLCFELDVNHQIIEDSDIRIYILNLIVHMENINRYHDLVEKVLDMRPNYDWE